jgi:DNA-binding HxlR family transcriptional regulator
MLAPGMPKALAAKADDFCPVHEAIAVLQGKWTLHIVEALLDGPRGFNDLARAIGGCNPATLAERLETLAALGVLTKTVESTMPPRTSYALTRSGAALQEVVTAIERWGARHLPRAALASATRRKAARRRPRG